METSKDCIVVKCPNSEDFPYITLATPDEMAEGKWLCNWCDRKHEIEKTKYGG